MEKNAFVALLITVVRGLAAKWPNAVYTRCEGLCLYDKGKVENGPDFEGCIFGQAFRIIGPMIPVDFTKDNWDNYYINNKDVKAIWKLLDGYCYPNTNQSYVDWCSKVQAEQDGGGTWGEGVKAADFLFKIDV